MGTRDPILLEPPGAADPRIEEFTRLARRMAEGELLIHPPPPTDDDVGQLGAALEALGRSLERRMSELHAVLAIAGEINAGVTLNDVLDHVYASFEVLIPYDRLGCALVDAGTGLVESIWARSRSGRPPLLPRGYSAPLAGSSLAEIVASGRPRILNDLPRYLEEHPSSDATRRLVAEGVRSSLTCPLLANGAPIGFLFFSSNAPATYTEAHPALYQAIAAQVSLAVERSLAHDELLATKNRLVQANRELARVAYLDALTGIPSRRTFDRVLEREWKRAARYGEAFSVVALDVDHFKAFNDSYGHPAGDDCLRRVAQALAGATKRGADLLARIGGEEFAVVLPRTTPAEAIVVGERLRRSVETLAIPHAHSSAAPRVTVSVGIAGCSPGVDGSAAALLAAADGALYRAKAAGRNRVVVAE